MISKSNKHVVHFSSSVLSRLPGLVFNAVFAVFLLMASPAYALYTVNVTENGGNVTFSGSGSINLTGLFLAFSGSLLDGISPTAPRLAVGQVGTVDVYVGPSLVRPPNFGTGGPALVASSSGSMVRADLTSISVPNNYISGAALGTSTATFAGSLASLGLVPGIYTWSWGSGASADSLVLNISAPTHSAIPTLGEWAMILMASLMAMFGIRRMRRSK